MLRLASVSARADAPSPRPAARGVRLSAVRARAVRTYLVRLLKPGTSAVQLYGFTVDELYSRLVPYVSHVVYRTGRNGVYR